MININTLSEQEFNALPLVVEGESKIVRDAGDGLAVIKLKPTIYSFTHNRCGVVSGSDLLRLRATKTLTSVLKQAGINHSYLDVNDKFILSKLIKSPPPIEVVVKAFHSGTSKHRYDGMSASVVRNSHPLFAGMKIEPEGAYPSPIVRFDWRNPLLAKDGKTRLADEVLGESQADWFIDVAKAKITALKTYRALATFLGERDIILYDICLFITEDGETVYGEISQDCGRFRHFDLGSLDKDVWRAGGSSDVVLQKWEMLLKLINGSVEESINTAQEIVTRE